MAYTELHTGDLMMKPDKPQEFAKWCVKSIQKREKMTINRDDNGKELKIIINTFFVNRELKFFITDYEVVR